MSSVEKLYYLDLNSPSIVQPVEPGDQAIETYKFVQVEVVEVVNPKRHQLSFKVYYQTKANEKIYLGSFGLYPSDNPGKFIVATQGKVKRDGAIVLSMVRPDQVEATDTMKVGIKKIRLVEGRR